MATFLPIRCFLSGLIFATTSSLAHAAECDFIESYIEIRNWTNPPPKKVYMEIVPFDKGLEPPKNIKYKATVTEPVPAYGLGRGLALIQDEKPMHRLKVDDSLVLFFDDSPIYRISNIKSTNQIQLACPIQSFKVNDCIGSRGANLRFDASCR